MLPGTLVLSKAQWCEYYVFKFGTALCLAYVVLNLLCKTLQVNIAGLAISFQYGFHHRRVKMDIAHILCAAKQAAVMELHPVEIYQLELEFPVFYLIENVVYVKIVVNQTT